MVLSMSTPNANISLTCEGFARLLITSGAINPSVPPNCDADTDADSKFRLISKSHKRGVPSAAMSTFSPFRSQWARPCAWM